MSTVKLIIYQYPMGALSFRFEGESDVWPVKDYKEINLDQIPQGNGRQTELLNELSLCLGLQRKECLLRPNGFNVIPDGSLSLRVIIDNLTMISKKFLEDNIAVENRVNL